MRIQTIIPDEELMDDCIGLTYNIEFGELHERDKYTWVEQMSNTAPLEEDEDVIFKKVKHMDFEFKMNHIK